VPTPVATAAPTSSAQATSVVPQPVVPAAPAPIQCGPDEAPCKSGTYCDPQPLCSIGEDCPGVCLPNVQIRFSNVSFIPPFSNQPIPVSQKPQLDMAANLYIYSNGIRRARKRGGRFGRSCWTTVITSCIGIVYEKESWAVVSRYGQAVDTSGCWTGAEIATEQR
jgi:hypothetical protein